MLRAVLLGLVFCLLMAGPVAAQVVGIETHSTYPGIEPEALLSCVSGALKGTKGIYLKTIESPGAFRSDRTDAIAKQQRIDLVYHYSFFEKDSRPTHELTVYNIAQKRITATRTRAMAQDERPCDLAVMETLDLLGKETTWIDKATPHLNQGRALAAQGRFDEAVPFYMQASQACPGAGFIYREMGYYLEGGGRPDWALEWYKSALEADDLEILSILRIARIFQARGEMEAASNFVEQHLDRRPKPPRIYVELARLYQQQERVEQAWRFFEQAQQLDPDDADALDRLIAMLIADKQWAKATKHQLRFIRANPNDAAARGMLLELYIKAENYNAAIPLLDSFLQGRPDEPTWIYWYGKALEARHDWAGAKAKYNRLLALEPKSDLAHFALARIAYREQRYADAKSHLQWTLSYAPANPDALQMLGRVQEMDKDYAGAIETQKLLILWGEGVRETDLLRLFSLGRKANDMAVVEREVLDLIGYKTQPVKRKLIMALAGAMVDDGRKGDALKILQSRFRVLERHGPAYLLRGRLLLEQERFDEAEELFRRGTFQTADDLFPFKVGLMFHKLDRYSQAEFFYQFAINRSRNNPKISLQFLEVAVLNEDFNNALWTIHDLSAMDLSPLYRQYFAFLQILYAKLKGDQAFAANALSYGLKLIEHYGGSDRLDFHDFPPLIQRRFQDPDKTMLLDLVALFENKMDLARFTERHPQ